MTRFGSDDGHADFTFRQNAPGNISMTGSSTFASNGINACAYAHPAGPMCADTARHALADVEMTYAGVFFSSFGRSIYHAYSTRS